MKGYGDHVQYSIFRCRLTERQLERLRWELSRILEREDSLLVVRLCARCSANLTWRNPPEAWPAERGSYEVL
jgi:CRISPR-associated protein Cas2